MIQKALQHGGRRAVDKGVELLVLVEQLGQQTSGRCMRRMFSAVSKYYQRLVIGIHNTAFTRAACRTTTPVCTPRRVSVDNSCTATELLGLHGGPILNYEDYWINTAC